LLCFDGKLCTSSVSQDGSAHKNKLKYWHGETVIVGVSGDGEYGVLLKTALQGAHWRLQGAEHEIKIKGNKRHAIASQNDLQTSTEKVAAMHGGACFRYAPIKQTVFESTSYGYPQAACSSRKGRSRRPPPLRVRAQVPWQQPWQGQQQHHPWQQQRVRRRQGRHRRERMKAWSFLHAVLEKMVTKRGKQQECKIIHIQTTSRRRSTGGNDLLGSLSSELSDELLDLLGIGLATAGSDDGGDISLSGVGFSAENGEEISGDVLHDSVSALLWGAATCRAAIALKTRGREVECRLRQKIPLQL
jgi:hypothetical protein